MYQCRYTDSVRIVQNGDSRLVLADDHLVLDFPYSDTQVAETKRIPGAQWDRVARVWRIPLESLDEARDFATRHDFTIGPDVLRFTLPAPLAGGVTAGRKRLRLEQRKILLEFGFDTLIAEAARALPATTWDRRRKCFVADLSGVIEIVAFARRFGFDIPQELLDAETDTRDSLSGRIDASRALDAEIDIPGLGGELKHFQRAGIAYVLDARRTFLADDMGTGKTIQALAALEAAGTFPAVIVCPATLVLNWQREARIWLPSRTSRVINGRADPGALDTDLVIVGWPNLASHVERLSGFASYVFDESHAAKNYDAARTKAAIKVAKNAPGLVLCLTGTPVTNRPAEYASQLEILGRLDEFGGRWAFYKRYANAFRDRWGQWNLSGHAHLDELNDKLRASCYVRRSKAEVMPELSPVETAIRLVPPDKKVFADYRNAEEDIVAYVAERAAQIALELGKKPGSAAVRARFAAEANEHLVRLSALRRLAALSKMDAVTEIVEELVEQGRKVVLAAHHREVVDALASRFGGLKIQGGMAVADIEEAKAKFQTLPIDQAPVIVLSVTAAATGHTLTASQDVVFVEEPWTPADVDQIVARCHRLGQQGSVTAWHLLAADTVDERVHDLVERKRRVVRAATDGGEVSGEVGVVAEVLTGFFPT